MKIHAYEIHKIINAKFKSAGTSPWCTPAIPVGDQSGLCGGSCFKRKRGEEGTLPTFRQKTHILGNFALLLLRTRHKGRLAYELTESRSPEF